MPESLLAISLRSFLKAFFTLLGICLAFIPLILIFSLFSKSESEPESHFSMAYLPNAEGERKVVSKSAPVILSIPIIGVVGTDNVTMHHIRDMLVESREGSLKKDRVKALFLHIETPGGTVVDADGIYHAIKAYKEKYNVPVYAYVDGLCASGGMYIASAADKVYASNVSLVGSVGVLIPALLNFSKLINTVGIESLTLSAGIGKDELNPLRPWKPGEQDAMQAIVNNYYEQFVSIVTTARPKLDKEKLVQEYGAHVYPAKQAEEYGFIDGSGLSRNETLKLLLKKLNIEDHYYQVVQLEKESWYNTLFSSESPIRTGQIKHQLQLTKGLSMEMMNQPLYLYQPGM
ncbi:MAG: S49 family peptidase [Parachlamydia sp.]|nr:S49 family peptidase [Parachlamydia sp.]